MALDRRYQIRKAAKAGVAPRKIAKDMGVSRRHVNDVLAGFDPSELQRNGRHRPKKRKGHQ